jgi:hypothetical protein
LLNGRDFSAIKVKVGATNCSGCNAENDVVVFLDYWVGNRVDLHTVGAVVGKCSHSKQPLHLPIGKWERGENRYKFRVIENVETGGQALAEIEILGACCKTLTVAESSVEFGSTRL